LACSLFEPNVLFSKVRKWRSDFRIVLDKFAVVVRKSQECLYVLDVLGRRPFYERGNLLRVYAYSINANDESEEVNFLPKELALF